MDISAAREPEATAFTVCQNCGFPVLEENDWKCMNCGVIHEFDDAPI